MNPYDPADPADRAIVDRAVEAAFDGCSDRRMSLILVAAKLRDQGITINGEARRRAEKYRDQLEAR